MEYALFSTKAGKFLISGKGFKLDRIVLCLIWVNSDREASHCEWIELIEIYSVELGFNNAPQQ